MGSGWAARPLAARPLAARPLTARPFAARRPTTSVPVAILPKESKEIAGLATSPELDVLSRVAHKTRGLRFLGRLLAGCSALALHDLFSSASNRAHAVWIVGLTGQFIQKATGECVARLAPFFTL
jgi:hypothetical protein